MNGAALLVDTLRRAGVEQVFSLSGNQIMPVYDACLDAGVRIVHVRHEAAAVHMADAWAQLGPRLGPGLGPGLGVALVTAGPGFANALQALFTARHDESPVLLLSGDSPAGADGDAAFQALDQRAMAAPVTKRTRRPRTPARMAHDVAAAIACARSGRPGPVHVALPFDVLNGEAAPADRASSDECARRERPLAPTSADAIAAHVAGAERPVVLTGPALNPSRAGRRLEALRAALGAPVTCMESPRGLRDPALGAFADALARADLVVSLAKPIDFTVGFARAPAIADSARLVVVDPDPTALDRARRLAGERVVLAACADADLAADALAAAARPRDRSEWCAEVDAAIANREILIEPTARIHPRDLCAAVQHVLERAADPILVCDGGEIGQWAQAFCSARTRIINGTGGAIGAALPFGVAAKLARPEATVVALMGDGTAGFHLAELETAAREGAAIVAVVGNDRRWNAEHQIQLRDYGPNRLIGCELSGARYDLAAAGLGCHGEHVEDAAALAPALERALASERPACVNVEIDGVAAPTFSARSPSAH